MADKKPDKKAHEIRSVIRSKNKKVTVSLSDGVIHFETT